MTEGPAPTQESAPEQTPPPDEPRPTESEEPQQAAPAPAPSEAGEQAEAEPAPPAEVADGHPRRFAAAHRLIEQGRVAEAADAFRSQLRAVGPARFTIQVLIACEPATVQKALAATRGEGDLIVVPFALQGRACYRTCWGIHASRQEALDSVS